MSLPFGPLPATSRSTGLSPCQGLYHSKPNRSGFPEMWKTSPQESRRPHGSPVQRREGEAGLGGEGWGLKATATQGWHEGPMVQTACKRSQERKGILQGKCAGVHGLSSTQELPSKAKTGNKISPNPYPQHTHIDHLLTPFHGTSVRAQ